MSALKEEALAEFKAREAAIDSLLAFTEYTYATLSRRLKEAV